jgi:DnaJ-domain-containing protein 1
VRRGHFTGRDLASMDRAELMELLADCQALDAESVPLIEAWLDRTDPEWREAAPPPPPPGGRMTRAEALAVLGLSEGADEAAIRAAHRRLMQSAHPDRGGSDWLASRVNEARDLLLG